MNKLFLCLSLLLACPACADEWADWRDSFNQSLAACAAPADCLSKAFTSRPLPAPDGASADDLLLRDLRVAQVVEQNKQASDMLWSRYGIDASAYLGTGYSVALNGPYARQYAFARQREYFVPNLCADIIDAVRCPSRARGLWTWRLTPRQLARWLDRPVSRLLAALPPQHDGRGFARQQRSRRPAGELPRLLIRFSPVPDAYYKGQVGRPDARRVFFADYDQAADVRLRDFVTATGTTGLDTPKPGTSYYLWLYAPGRDSPARAASWRAVFDLLSAP